MRIPTRPKRKVYARVGIPVVYLVPIGSADAGEFRSVVEAYWAEVMPYSAVLKEPRGRNSYFDERWSAVSS